MNTDSTDRAYLSLRDISKRYPIPLSSLRRFASERRFILYKVSNRIYVNIDEFNEWFEGFKVKNPLKKGVEK